MYKVSVYRRILLVAALTYLSVQATSYAQTNNKPASTTIVTLDGRELAVENLRLAAGELTGNGIEGKLAIDDIRKIQVRPQLETRQPTPGISIGLISNGHLTATDLTIGDDKCIVTTASTGKLELPIDAVRTVAFDKANLPADYHAAAEKPSADFDRLFLKVDKAVEGLTGLIESLDEQKIQFSTDAKSVEQPRERLVAIVVAQAIAGDELPQYTLTLVDGGSLGGELTAIAKQEIELKLAGEAIRLPWSAVERIDVRLSKMAFLSDLKPSSAEQQSIVTLTRPWQRDRSYSGRPLRIGQRSFEKGIGAHARSRLTFPLQGKYDQFAAVVGIDAATEGKGDCIMSVLADGNVLWTGRVKGTDPPQELNLKVSNVNELSLVVEAGEELDLADHANWADARVIRGSK